MNDEIEAFIARTIELRVLEPDAEADACGSTFEQFVRDRMDEWHAAIDAFDQRGTEGLSREVFVTRSALELCQRADQNPPWTRTLALAAELRRVTACSPIDRPCIEAVAALRSRWEPGFRQSKRWQMTVSLLSPAWAVPWIVQPCREITRTIRGVWMDRPSALAPWIALWSRGVWAMPLGDGGVGVWVPPVDEGEEGIDRALSQRLVNEWTQTDLTALGFYAPHTQRGPGCGGVEFFGYTQTDLLDQQEPLSLRSRAPAMAINPGPPPIMPPIPTNMPMPTPNLPTPPRPVTAEAEPAPEPPTPPDEPVSTLDRLRRWFKK